MIKANSVTISSSDIMTNCEICGEQFKSGDTRWLGLKAHYMIAHQYKVESQRTEKDASGLIETTYVILTP